MDFQQEYDTSTDTINKVLTTQLTSSWTNIPGDMIMVAPSTAGYLWGIRSQDNAVMYCQLPCTGNWKAVDLGQFNFSTASDIKADSTNVYVLIEDTSGAKKILVGPANTQGEWSAVPVPTAVTNIFLTHSYIISQDSQNNKQTCPKPCATYNWKPVIDEKQIKVSSTSDTTVYGLDASGNSLKTDEIFSSGWSPIAGFFGKKFSNLFGSADNYGLYGVGANSTVFCKGNCNDPSDIQPDSMTYTNIGSTPNSIWVTTVDQQPEDKGNIFTKLASPDYVSVMDNVNPINNKREEIVEKVEKEYQQQTQVMTANKVINDIVNSFKNIFKKDGTNVKENKKKEEDYHHKIQGVEMELNTTAAILNVIKKMLVILVIVFVVYLFSDFFGEYTHSFAFIGIVLGIWYNVYS